MYVPPATPSNVAIRLNVAPAAIDSCGVPFICRATGLQAALVKLSVSVGASYVPELTDPSSLVIRLNVDPLDKDSLLTAFI